MTFAMFVMGFSVAVFAQSQSSLHPAYLPNDDTRLLGTLLESLNVIELERAWDITQGDASVLVAVIDDAIDIRHPDLAQNMVLGWDFVAGDDDPSPTANSQCGVEEHGTWVASVIGAVGDNQQGVAGVSYKTRILPLKIGCEYNADYERAAVLFAVRKGAKIINMSYGGYVVSPYHDEIVKILEDNDVLLVTAAGNYHGDNDQSPFYPASINSANVITVAATTKAGVLAHWSNFGSFSVDVAAPGVNLPVANYDPSRRQQYVSQGRLAFSGTSASAPVVSGVAALLMAKDLWDSRQDYLARDVKAAVLASVKPTSVVGKLRADGVIDARRALEVIDRPHPLILLAGVRLDDAAGNNNGVLDSWEEAILHITLENVWQEAENVVATLHLDNPVVEVENNVGSFAKMLAGDKVSRAYRLSAKQIDQRQTFDFKLNIKSVGQESSQEVRYFSFQTGPLSDRVVMEDIIQQTAYDERHYYHIQLQEGIEKLIFELTYRPTNGREMGLSVQSKKMPRIDFLNYAGGGANYYGALHSTANAGVIRIEIDDQSLVESTYYAMVFNQPGDNNRLTYQFDRRYSLRACMQYPSDSTQAPMVDVGKNIRVAANSLVNIQGSASAFDSQSSLVNLWWQQISGPLVQLSGIRSLALSFTAPRTGEMVFKLNVSDNQCRYTQKTLKVTVNDKMDQVNGLRLLPGSIEVGVGAFIAINISAIANNAPVSAIVAKSIPEGASFDTTNNLLQWPNAGPAGIYLVTFTVNNTTSIAEQLSANFTIKVGAPESNYSVSGRFESGGCTMMALTSYDPILVCLLLLSVFVIHIHSRKI